MRYLPMYENTPGIPDLVYHTVKHFLADGERAEWDQLPTGTRTAESAWTDIRREALVRPPRGHLPAIGWWGPPWVEHVRRAHDDGYRPRYDLLLSQAGQPAGAGWEPTWKGRRLTEYLGFRLIVKPVGADFQVINAFFSPRFLGAGDLSVVVPALRAFVARRNCPPEARSRVGGLVNKT